MTSSNMRAGGTTAGLLTTLVALGVLTTVAALVAPSYLNANSIPVVEPVVARDAAHQQMIEILAALIGRSREIVAIHDRGASPYLELVVWLEDQDHSGEPDPDEIAIISHSEVMQTILCFGYDEADDASDEPLPPGWTALNKPGPPLPSMADIDRADFCAAWRDHPLVTRRVLAARIASLAVTEVSRSEDGAALLEISLTWASESADGPDMASVPVDVVLRQPTDA